ncbi:hypothetical protein ACWD04_33915 [Streptomyces sp. NPDC002911]
MTETVAFVVVPLAAAAAVATAAGHLRASKRQAVREGRVLDHLGRSPHLTEEQMRQAVAMDADVATKVLVRLRAAGAIERRLSSVSGANLCTGASTTTFAA